jgi:predicted outer membrane repeat protein
MGGGIYGADSGLTISNCEIEDCYANLGAGVYLAARATLDGCYLEDNWAKGDYSKSMADGGGIYIDSGTYTPVVDINDCEIVECGAYGDGGAIYNDEGDLDLTNCEIESCDADSGGAVYNNGASDVVITNCTFNNNDVTEKGGAIFSSDELEQLYIDGCIFKKCDAEYGGALYNDGGMNDYSSTIANCVFQNNDADESGGAIYNSSGTYEYEEFYIVNCVFYDNEAEGQDGGAIYNDNIETEEVEVINCTFFGNLADDYGGAVYNYDSDITITNSILWADSAGTNGDEIYNNSSTPTVTYCCVEGGYSGTGNTSSDLNFVDDTDPDGTDNDWGTSDDGLIPTDNNVVDSGNDHAVPDDIDEDIKGDNRFNGTVDMGAYEDQS